MGIRGGGTPKRLLFAAVYATIGTVLPTAAVEVEDAALLNSSFENTLTDLQRYDEALTEDLTNTTEEDILTDGTPTGFAASAYSVTDGTASDYSYKTEVLNADGSTTVKYYKIVLNNSRMSTKGNVTWTEVSQAGNNTIAITLPNNQVKYLKYDYSTPSGYTTSTTGLSSVSSSSNVTNVTYSGVENSQTGTMGSRSGGSDTDYGSSSGSNADASANASVSASRNDSNYGGAIRNSNSNSSLNITADFVGNSVKQITTAGSAYGGTANAYGGTAYDSDTDKSGSYSSSNSLSSYASASADASAYAGASADGTANAYGGAIANTGGALGKISGKFINNYVYAEGNGGYAKGGSAHAEGGSATAVSGDVSISVDVTDSTTTTTPNNSDFYIRANASASSSAYASADAYCSVAASADGAANAYGGAISNAATMGDIEADFNGNYVWAHAKGGSAHHGSSSEYGGTASATAGSVSASASASGDITYTPTSGEEQSASASTSASASGGDDDYNTDRMDYPWRSGWWIEAQADADTSRTESESSSSDYSYAESADATSRAYGGAIYNTRTIGNITGNFTGNYAKATGQTGIASSKTLNTQSYGGAIYNSSTIGTIKGDFTRNYAIADNGAYGGAIHNTGTIAGISGTFTENTIIANSLQGGAIYNTGTITNGITASKFINNYVDSKVANNTVYGGAIYNTRAISTNGIQADFIGNYAKSASGTAYGGAIYNTAALANISGTFSGNYAQSNVAYGGALYTSGATITKIDNAKFADNYVKSASGLAYGGAIYNHTSSSNIITTISNSTFSGNYAESATTHAYGGALWGGYRVATVSDTNFLHNHVKTTAAAADAFGGGVYNAYTFGYTALSKLNFTGNYAESLRHAYGGGLYNSNTVTRVITDSTFKENYVKSTGASGNALGGAIYNSSSMSAGVTGSTFSGNYAMNTVASQNALGGAIYNQSNFGVLTNDAFTGNSVSATTGQAHGGAIYNSSTFGAITNTTFTENHANATTGPAQGGAIWTNRNITFGNGSTPLTFTGNYVDSASGSAQGGALYYGYTNALTLTNATFKNNYAHTTSGTALGGAIWTNYNTTIVASGGLTSEFTGNYVQTGTGEKVNDAIYMGNNSYKTLTLNANGGKILFNDNLNGVSGWTLSMTGGSSDTSLISLYGQVKNATNANLATTHLTFGENTFNTSGLTFNANSGYIELKDSAFKTYNFNKISGSTSARWNIDVDLANQKSDMIKTSQKSSGYVYIYDVNTEGVPKEDGKVKVRVLDTQASGLQLSLYSGLTSRKQLNQVHDYHCDNMTPDIAWNAKYIETDDTWTTYGQLALATTVTTNDSIEYTVTTQKTNTTTRDAGDTLMLWNQFDSPTKNFNFAAATNVYNSAENVGTSAGTTLNVNGVSASDTSKSTINLASHTGFVLGSGKTLNLKDVQFTNAVNSDGSVVNVESGGTANLNGVIMATANAAAPIANAGTLNFTGNKSTLKAPVSGTGTMNVNSNVQIFDVNSRSNEVAITQGTVNVNNGGTLTVYNNAKINADLVIKNGGTTKVGATGITKAVSNDGRLDLYGSGAIAYAVNGAGTTTIYDNASITNTGGINQAVTVESGSTLTNSAALGSDSGVITNAGTIISSGTNIKGNVTNNNALTLNGGTLSKAVSGTGTTTISGNMTNSAGINQKVNVNSGVTLTNNSTLGSDTGVITNAGVISTSATNIKGTVTNKAQPT